MTDNANKPGEQRSDSAQNRPDKVSENLSKGTPEVNHSNLRAAQKANQNRTDTVSPDGKSRFSLTDESKANEKQAKAAQETAYRDAGLGDPHKPIGKPSEPKPEAIQHKPVAELGKSIEVNAERAKEAAARVFQSVYSSGRSAVNETGKFLKGMGDGEVEYVKELGDSLNVAGEYYGRALTGKVNLAADVKEFTGAIGQTLGTAGDYYINQLPKGQANLGNDISQAGKAATERWNSLDTEHKGKFFGKEVVPLAVPGAVGIVAKEVQSANLVGKAGEAIIGLTSAEQFAQMEQKINQLQGHVQKFSEVLAKPLQPAYATVSDGPGRQSVPLDTPKLNDSILMKHGDKGLPQGVKPSEKVLIKEQFNSKGEVIHGIDVPSEVLKAADLRGFDKVAVQEKLQKIAENVKDVYSKLGDFDPKIHGTERAYGNKFHEMLRENLNKLGDPAINTEASYLKGNTSNWGKLGSSRVDIILGEEDKPFVSICLKTLKAVPSAQQERGWVKNLVKLPDGSVPPRLHLKLPDPEK